MRGSSNSSSKSRQSRVDANTFLTHEEAEELDFLRRTIGCAGTIFQESLTRIHIENADDGDTFRGNRRRRRMRAKVREIGISRDIPRNEWSAIPPPLTTTIPQGCCEAPPSCRAKSAQYQSKREDEAHCGAHEKRGVWKDLQETRSTDPYVAS